MIDKSIYIILFMYFLSFGMLGIQYVIGDAFNIEMTSFDGTPIKPALLSITDIDNLNTVTTNIANATDAENSTLDAITNAFQLGYNVGKDLLLLLTGTYIFNVLYLLGVPAIIIVGMVIIYVLLLGRTLIALIRGV